MKPLRVDQPPIPPPRHFVATFSPQGFLVVASTAVIGVENFGWSFKNPLSIPALGSSAHRAQKIPDSFEEMQVQLAMIGKAVRSYQESDSKGARPAVSDQNIPLSHPQPKEEFPKEQNGSTSAAAVNSDSESEYESSYISELDAEGSEHSDSQFSEMISVGENDYSSMQSLSQSDSDIDIDHSNVMMIPADVTEVTNFESDYNLLSYSQYDVSSMVSNSLEEFTGDNSAMLDISPQISQEKVSTQYLVADRYGLDVRTAVSIYQLDLSKFGIILEHEMFSSDHSEAIDRTEKVARSVVASLEFWNKMRKQSNEKENMDYSSEFKSPISELPSILTDLSRLSNLSSHSFQAQIPTSICGYLSPGAAVAARLAQLSSAHALYTLLERGDIFAAARFLSILPAAFYYMINPGIASEEKYSRSKSSILNNRGFFDFPSEGIIRDGRAAATVLLRLCASILRSQMRPLEAVSVMKLCMQLDDSSERTDKDKDVFSSPVVDGDFYLQLAHPKIAGVSPILTHPGASVDIATSSEGSSVSLQQSNEAYSGKAPNVSAGPVCAVCEEVVRGAFVLCPCCGHGGHLSHMREWFLVNTPGTADPLLYPPEADELYSRMHERPVTPICRNKDTQEEDYDGLECKSKSNIGTFAALIDPLDNLLFESHRYNGFDAQDDEEYKVFHEVEQKKEKRKAEFFGNVGSTLFQSRRVSYDLCSGCPTGCGCEMCFEMSIECDVYPMAIVR